MNKVEDKREVDATLRATSSVMELLPQLAGLVAGLGVIALFIGWRETSTYFSEMGAPWAAGMQSTNDLIRVSVGIASVMGFVTLISMFWLTQKQTTRKHLAWWSIAASSLGAVFFAVQFLPFGWLTPRMAYSFTIVGAYLVAVSAGFTVGEMIAHFAERGPTWDTHSFWLLYFFILVGFMQAPRELGTATAQLDGDYKSSRLPVVILASPQPGREWRLVRTLDGSFLVVSLAAQRQDRVFRVLAANEITEIRSSHLK